MKADKTRNVPASSNQQTDDNHQTGKQAATQPTDQHQLFLDSTLVKILPLSHYLLPKADPPTSESQRGLKRRADDKAADEDLSHPAKRDQQVPTTRANQQDARSQSSARASERAKKTADDVDKFLISTFQEFRDDLDAVVLVENADKRPDNGPSEISSNFELSPGEVLQDSDDDVIILGDDFKPKIVAKLSQPANDVKEGDESNGSGEAQQGDESNGSGEEQQTAFSANDALAITPRPQIADHTQLRAVQVGMQYISKIESPFKPALYNCSLCKPLGVKYLYRHTIVAHLLGKRHQIAHLKEKNGLPSVQYTAPTVYRKPYVKPRPYTNTRPSFNGYNGWHVPYQPQHAYPDSFDRPYIPPVHQQCPPSHPYAVQNHQSSYPYSNNGDLSYQANNCDPSYYSNHQEFPYYSNYQESPYYSNYEEPSFQANNAEPAYYPNQADSSFYPNQAISSHCYSNQGDSSLYPYQGDTQHYANHGDPPFHANPPVYHQPKPKWPLPNESGLLPFAEEDRYLVYISRQITASNDDLMASYDHLKTVERLLKTIVAEYNAELPPLYNARNGEKNRILELPMRVGLFAKKLSLKNDFKLVELVLPCRVLPTVGLLKLLREQLSKKFEQIPNETYTALENIEKSAIDVKSANGLLIRTTLTSNLIRDKAAAQRLDKGLSKDECIHALDAQIKMDWWKATVCKHKPITMIIKLCRHLKDREPSSWGAFNNWQLQVLCYDLIRSEFKCQPTPSMALKCVLGRLADGYLHNSGISVADPCRTDLLKKENFLRRLEPEKKQLITESAREFHQLAMNNRWELIFGDSENM